MIVIVHVTKDIPDTKAHNEFSPCIQSLKFGTKNINISLYGIYVLSFCFSHCISVFSLFISLFWFHLFVDFIVNSRWSHIQNQLSFLQYVCLSGICFCCYCSIKIRLARYSTNFICIAFSCIHHVSLLRDSVCAICMSIFVHTYVEMMHCTMHSTWDLLLNWYNIAHKKSPTALVECIWCMPLEALTILIYCTVSMLLWSSAI